MNAVELQIILWGIFVAATYLYQHKNELMAFSKH